MGESGGADESWTYAKAGVGAAFKMINQLLAGVHIAAASEAIAFAARQGLDLRKIYEVITASAGNSWMFENRIPHVLDGDYTPRSAVDIFVKDLGIIQDMQRRQMFAPFGDVRGVGKIRAGEYVVHERTQTAGIDRRT